MDLWTRVAGAACALAWVAVPAASQEVTYRSSETADVARVYRGGIEPRLLLMAWSGVKDSIARVFALLGGYRRLLVESDYRLGSPIGNIALETAEPDPEVRQRPRPPIKAQEDALFAGRKSGLRPVYDAVRASIVGLGGDVDVAPEKAYVSHRRKKQLALVEPSAATRLDVGLSLEAAGSDVCRRAAARLGLAIADRAATRCSSFPTSIWLR